MHPPDCACRLHLGRREAIRAAIGLVPAAVAVIAMIIFWKYPLNDDFFRKIRNETETRKLESDRLVLADGQEVDPHKL